jgi:hypothetical protein
MRGPQALLGSEDHHVTEMGAWFPGERVVFRGKDLHEDLGRLDWLDLYMFAITGRHLPYRHLQMVNALWVHTSFPDPRLWNNQVSALAGTARSTGNLAIAASLAVSEATIYGRRADIRAIDFLLNTLKAVDAGVDLGEWVEERLAGSRSVPGYGRPVVSQDERIRNLLPLVDEFGFAEGRYVRLAFSIERILENRRRRLCLNYGGLAAALGAEMGLSPKEHYLGSMMAFLAGMIPCFLDGDSKPEGALLPLRCSRVEYQGRPRRTWIGA